MNFDNQEITFKPKSLFDDKDFQDRLMEKKKRIIDDYRPREADFTDIYSKDEIDKDLSDVAELKAQWADQSENDKYLKKVSSIYECIVADQVGANAWFGENCEAVATSEYDDIKNGVDVVTVFSKEDKKQYLGLGVDVTFASDKKVLEKKLESIKQCIRVRTLPSLKYFQDPDTREHKKLYLPKVIIGSRMSSAEKLIQLWGGKDQARNKKLAEHPVASKIILETLAQLKYFYEYAMVLSNGSTDTIAKSEYKKIAIEYGKMYNEFVDVYQSKKDLIDSHLTEISDDIIYETIIDYTNKG